MTPRIWLALAALAVAGCAGGSPLQPDARTQAASQLAARSTGSLEAEIRALDAAAFAARDADHDGRLSPQEAGLSPESLAFWETTRDGFLDAGEYQAARGPVSERAAEARRVLEGAAADPETADVAGLGLAQALPRFSVEAAGGNPVLCVPGFLDLELYFAPLRKKLEKQGRRTYYLEVFPNVGDIRNSATVLSRLVAQAKAETGAKQVDLLAHSMGGLISRTYMQDYDGMRNVQHLVSLASPYHGTEVARIAPTAGAAQMRPGSDFIKAMNAKGETPGSVKYTSIRAGLDEIVIPHDSPILQGAEENVLAPAAMHGTIFVDPITWKAVQRGLAR